MGRKSILGLFFGICQFGRNRLLARTFLNESDLQFIHFGNCAWQSDSNWNTSFALKLGGLGIVLVFATLGLRLDFNNLTLPFVFGGLVLVWLILHFLGMILVSKALKLNLIWVPIASMANLGGISSTPAVTAAYWKDLMPHAVLLAILSMVTGTAWWMLTFYFFSKWIG